MNTTRSQLCHLVYYGQALRLSLLAAAVVLVARLDAADSRVTLWAQAVSESWVEQARPDLPVPRWDEAPAILGAPDGRWARLVVPNGWNDYGSLTLDMGVEIAAGEILVFFQQQGPGADKSTDLWIAGTDKQFRRIKRLGCPSEKTLARVRFDLPTRYIRLYAGAGGAVDRDSTWSFEAVGIVAEPRALRVAGMMPQRLADLERALSQPAVAARLPRNVRTEQLARIRALRQRIGQLQARCERNPQATAKEAALAYEAIKGQTRRLLAAGWQLLNQALAFSSLPRDAAPPFFITWDSALRKIRPQDPYPIAAPTLETTLHLAQNEYEAAQLVIFVNSQALRNVVVTASSWRPVEGQAHREGRLPGPEIFRVGYVISRGTEWPDPLFPEALAEAVPASRPQSFWLRVHVPEGTPPGLYECIVKVGAEGCPPAQARLRARVYSFALPRQGKLEVVFGCGSPPEYHAELLRHRLHPGGACCAAPVDADYTLQPDGRLEIDFTRYDQATAQYLAQGMNIFGLPYTCGDGGGLIPERMQKRAQDPATGQSVSVSLNPFDGPRERARLAQFVRDFRDHLRERGWLRYAFVYLWDEPAPRDYEAIRQIAAIIKENAPELPIALTTAPAAELMAAADIFCPHVHWGALFADGDRRMLEQARKEGKRLWWYNCGDPCPYPTFAIPHSMAAVRMMFWLNYKLGLTGNLYWAACFWPEHMKPERNGPYREPGGAGVGDGMLFYPPDRPGRIIGSLRLEAIRDGIEDYEALWLLAGATDGRASLLQIPAALARDPGSYTEEPEAIEGYRQRVYAALAGVYRGGSSPQKH